ILIHAASVSGIAPDPEVSAYGARKAAARHFSKIAAVEFAVARSGIRVNLVIPDCVLSPMGLLPGVGRQAGRDGEGIRGDGGRIRRPAFSSREGGARTAFCLDSDGSAHMIGVEHVIARGATGRRMALR